MECLPFVVDDNSLDDAELWDFIDSTVARRRSHIPHKPLLIAHHAPALPIVTELPPSPHISNDNSEQKRIPKCQKRQLPATSPLAGSKKYPCLQPAYKIETSELALTESKQYPRLQHQKVARYEQSTSEANRSERFQHVMETRDSMQRSYQPAGFQSNEIIAHDAAVSSSYELVERSRGSALWSEGKENLRLTGNSSAANEWMSGVPSASLFKHIQNAAMSVLEKGDYVLMQGKPFIKKCGWRKIAFFFNISFEIKDRTIKFDQNSNVQRAEFVVRASMQSGRFSDGWGSCDRGEKRYTKPNHDIPSTAETRAKTRACQDLLGIGEYKSGNGGW